MVTGGGAGPPLSPGPAVFPACKCTYEGKTYGYGDVVYNTTDGLGACLVAVCGDNGTIARWTMDCPGALSTTPFTFTSTAALPSTTSRVTQGEPGGLGAGGRPSRPSGQASWNPAGAWGPALGQGAVCCPTPGTRLSRVQRGLTGPPPLPRRPGAHALHCVRARGLPLVRLVRQWPPRARHGWWGLRDVC